jgi:glycosyltransferase involved in cell wall biosynthesis
MVRSARHHARILANSQYTAGLLNNIGLPSTQVRVLPGGVDASRFRPAGDPQSAIRARLGLPPASYLLMTACRLVPKKGLGLLLRALAALLPAMPDAHLLVVGDGRESAPAQRLAHFLGVAHAVTFTGTVPHHRLHEYYWAADQFLLASREHVDPGTGLRDVETMGRVLCEANAAGLPAIAARSGGIPSIIQHGVNGLLFDQDAQDQLTARITQLRNDPPLARQLATAGLHRATREFDWSVICAAHEAEFQLLA